MKKYPETIEHRWDILYRDYPEVYDRFASFPYSPRPVDVLNARFNFKDKVIVDNGAGTGKSAIAMSEYARAIIGVEPEAAMRQLATERVKKLGIKNVRFVEGSGQAIPLPDGTADVFTSFTGGLQSIPETKRILRRPGWIVSLDIAPDTYGGDLNEVLNHPTPELQSYSDFLVRTNGFSYEDFESIQEYGTVENIVETYGFIFGHKAIEHLQATGKTSIRWTFRIHCLELSAHHQSISTAGVFLAFNTGKYLEIETWQNTVFQHRDLFLRRFKESMT
jgi:ubiquinone/menaquinone biosynthesis C-methylase UbiE